MPTATLDPYIYGTRIPSRLDAALQLGAGADVEGNVLYDDGEAGAFSTGAQSRSRGWVDGMQGLLLDWAAGLIDAQVLKARELRIEVLIAEIQQALAGERVLAKSLAILAEPFEVPAVGEIGYPVFEDLAGLDGFQVFETGDTVQLKVTDRTYADGQGLLVAEFWGRVTNYTDLDDGKQKWRWTTKSVGVASAGYVVPQGMVALDWGVPGDGLIDETVIDPAASPRRRVVQWYDDNSDGVPDRVEVIEQQGSLADLDYDGLDMKPYGTVSKAFYAYQDEDNLFAVDSSGLTLKTVDGAVDIQVGNGRLYNDGTNLAFTVGGVDLATRLGDIDSQFAALPETFAELADLDAYATIEALSGYVTSEGLSTTLGAYLLTSTFDALVSSLGAVPPGGFAGIIATADEDRATAALLAGMAAADVERTVDGDPIFGLDGNPIIRYQRQNMSARLVSSGDPAEGAARFEDDRATDGGTITNVYGLAIEGYEWNTANDKNPLVRDPDTGFAIPVISSLSVGGVVAQTTRDFALTSLLAGYTFTDADGNTGQTLAGISALANSMGAYVALVADAFGNIAAIELASGEEGSAIHLQADQISFGDENGVAAIFSAINTGDGLGLQIDTPLLNLTGDLSAHEAFVSRIEAATGTIGHLTAGNAYIGLDEMGYTEAGKTIAIAAGQTAGGSSPKALTSGAGTNYVSGFSRNEVPFDATATATFGTAVAGDDLEVRGTFTKSGSGTYDVDARLYVNGVLQATLNNIPPGPFSFSKTNVTTSGAVTVQIDLFLDSASPLSGSASAQVYEILSNQDRSVLAHSGIFFEDDEGNEVSVARADGYIKSGWQGIRIAGYDKSAGWARFRYDPATRKLYLDTRDTTGGNEVVKEIAFV